MNDAKYMGLDVHQATMSAAVRDSIGNLVMEATRKPARLEVEGRSQLRQDL